MRAHSWHGWAPVRRVGGPRARSGRATGGRLAWRRAAPARPAGTKVWAVFELRAAARPRPRWHGLCTCTTERMISKSVVRPARKALQSCDSCVWWGFGLACQLRMERHMAQVRPHQRSGFGSESGNHSQVSKRARWRTWVVERCRLLANSRRPSVCQRRRRGRRIARLSGFRCVVHRRHRRQHFRRRLR